MKRTEILNSLSIILEDYCDVEHFNEELNYESDLFLDVLEKMELIINCELCFGIHIEDSKVDKLVTIGDTVNYIYEQLKLKE